MALLPPRTLWLPKAGNRAEEYEDASRAVYPQRFDGPGASEARLAVADGASEAAFAREWANALTDAFVSRPPDLDALSEESLREWLAPAQAAWDAEVPWERIPWHGEAKARAGAFATLLGAVFDAAPEDAGRMRWRAAAVGDCCLFIVRGGELALSFPLDDAAQFDNSPALLCSNPANAGDMWENVRMEEGNCERGDLFIFASDAIAAWFLGRHAERERPWETLAALEAAGWSAWVDEQRREGLMRNDDVTLVAVKVV